MVNIKPLTAELQSVAIRELNELPSRIPEDLENLRQWITQQPHLHIQMDDQLLIQFLRGSKYSLEKAKERIDLFYTMKSKYPELFSITDIQSPEMQEMLSLNCWSPLPKPLNNDGPRIMIFRLNYVDPNQSVYDAARATSALLEMTLLHDPYACIHGVVYIVDLANFCMNHTMHMTPGLIKKTFAFFTKSLPLRIKALYYINTHPMALQFYRLILPLFPEKIKQRLCICGSDIMEIRKYIPLQYLPQDYGGENGSLDELGLETHRLCNENANYFTESGQFKVDESLRPGKPIDFDGTFGMEGSFRKLDVD